LSIAYCLLLTAYREQSIRLLAQLIPSALLFTTHYL